MVTTDFLTKPPFSRLFDAVFLLAVIALSLGLLHHHYQIIVASIPLDYYEGTAPYITGLIAEGVNPYSRALQPQAMYVYPPLYNILLAPLSILFGNSLELHRLFSAILIMMSTLLCFAAVSRMGGSRIYAGAAAAVGYAGFLFYITPVASTNALGLVLYVAVLLIPWRYKYNGKSLACACILGVLAFYAKQYFVLGMAMLCLYLFLFVSIRRALMLGVAYSVLLLSSLLVVHLTSPYYLDNTLFAPSIAMAQLQFPHIGRQQFVAYLALYWPILLATLGAMGMAAYESGPAAARKGLFAACRFRFNADDHPAELPATHFFWFCTLCATLVVWFSLARNPGNYLSYFFQLISPPLLIAAFSVIARQPAASRILMPLLLFSFYSVYTLLPDKFSATEDSWARVDQLISENEHILASQMLLPLLLKHDREVVQDGHTFYFIVAAKKPEFFWKSREEDRVAYIWNEYISSIYRRIERQEFDLIMVTPWDHRGIFVTNPPPFSSLTGREFLMKYYRRAESLPLSMTKRHGGGEYNLAVWRPLGE